MKTLAALIFAMTAGTIATAYECAQCTTNHNACTAGVAQHVCGADDSSCAETNRNAVLACDKAQAECIQQNVNNKCAALPTPTPAPTPTPNTSAPTGLTPPNTNAPTGLTPPDTKAPPTNTPAPSEDPQHEKR